LSVAVTVNVSEPTDDVLIALPLATVPMHDARPDCSMLTRPCARAPAARFASSARSSSLRAYASASS
jgi:hypothetical protein